MYKNFIKVMEKKLVKKLEIYNYQYLKKEKQFVGFYNEFVFRISFDEAGYGSRIEIHMEYDYPLVKNKLNIFPKHYMRYGFLGENENWNIEKAKIQNLDDIEYYVYDMQFIFENYFYLLVSKVTNTFELEYYIKQEYEILFNDYLKDIGEEDPSWIYSMKFLESGKSQENWTKEDDLRCQELIESMQDKQFPYEKIRKQILRNIEKNKLKLDKEIQHLFDDNCKSIKVDKEITPISLKSLLRKNKIIEEKLEKMGFSLNSNKNTQGLPRYGETLYYQKENYELLVILKDELFLEFIIQKENYSKRVNIYDGSYFWFGWLVGKESTRDKNINEALAKLELSCPK